MAETEGRDASRLKRSLRALVSRGRGRGSGRVVPGWVLVMWGKKNNSILLQSKIHPPTTIPQIPPPTHT